MMTQLKALKLELIGMKRRGRSAYIVIKEQYGLKGNKQKVYDQFEKMHNEQKEEYLKLKKQRNAGEAN